MGIPTNPPVFQTLNWLALVQKLDPDYSKSEVVYEFSNGRKFESSDRGETGVYRND